VTTDERLRLPLAGGERLAVRFRPASEGTRAPFCVLYLHGFGSAQSGEKAEHFRARAAERGLPFCSFDLRGHGGSDGSLRSLTFAHCLEDLAAVRSWLEQRGERRIVLFGSSMGAATALWHAGERPEGLLAAVHVAPAVAMRAGLERWAGEAGLERWRRDGTARFRNGLVDAELGWELVEDLRARDFAALAARYRTPTLVFQGRLDATVDCRDVEAFAARCPPGVVDLRIFEDGDHRLIERKDQIWATACEWLDRIS
jgi:pimeloyl-ACP methyl ester carboxylesterase